MTWRATGRFSRSPAATLLGGSCALVVSGALCGADSLPEFTQSHLEAGRAVWMSTCRDCHANPVSDAPQVKDTIDWEKRLAKGIETLYASALTGVVTPNTEMPPRGGNAKLSDSEVRTAVDYMIAISTGIRSQP